MVGDNFGGEVEGKEIRKSVHAGRSIVKRRNAEGRQVSDFPSRGARKRRRSKPYLGIGRKIEVGDRRQTSPPQKLQESSLPLRNVLEKDARWQIRDPRKNSPQLTNRMWTRTEYCRMGESVHIEHGRA